MPNPEVFSQYLNLPGTGTQRARAGWTPDLDGYTDGFFLAARWGTNDIVGFGDAQTIAAMWRGAGAPERTFHWFLDDTANPGKLVLQWEDSLGAIAAEV